MCIYTSSIKAGNSLLLLTLYEPIPLVFWCVVSFQHCTLYPLKLPSIDSLIGGDLIYVSCVVKLRIEIPLVVGLVRRTSALMKQNQKRGKAILVM